MGAKKILIVDDEADFVQNVQSYFQIYGYECLTAFNGQEGLAKIEQEHPRLVILDILMPNMDGYTMLRELKKRKIDILCIIMTAKEKLKDLFELERVDRFLTKPFDLQKLKEIVDEMIEHDEGKSEPPATIEAPKGDTTTILIVEDEIKLAQNIEQYLIIKGYKVFSVCTGEDGLRALSTYQPDIVVTDICMPHMDGYSFVKELRKRYRTMPVIVVTAKEQMRELLEIEGADAFISKPFDISFLEQTIVNILAKRRENK